MAYHGNQINVPGHNYIIWDKKAQCTKCCFYVDIDKALVFWNKMYQNFDIFVEEYFTLGKIHGMSLAKLLF